MCQNGTSATEDCINCILYLVTSINLYNLKSVRKKTLLLVSWYCRNLSPSSQIWDFFGPLSKIAKNTSALNSRIYHKWNIFFGKGTAATTFNELTDWFGAAISSIKLCECSVIKPTCKAFVEPMHSGDWNSQHCTWACLTLLDIRTGCV